MDNAARTAEGQYVAHLNGLVIAHARCEPGEDYALMDRLEAEWPNAEIAPMHGSQRPACMGDFVTVNEHGEAILQ